MNLRNSLAEKVFVPLYERRWGLSPGKLVQSLVASQYKSADEIRSTQWMAVRHLLEHASSSNPFYRKRFRAAGFEIGDLREWRDFESLPLLTKQDIRNHGDALISDGYARDDMFYKRTGGSTGVPLRLFWDHDAHRFKRALAKRHDLWAGYKLGMKQAALWGDTEKEYPLKERLFKFLCERTIFLDTLRMDDRHLRKFIERVRRFHPSILIGHAHSLYFFTQYLSSKGIEDIRFKGIISTAETLSPAEREAIESYFGPVLFNRYGCEEVSVIASECDQHTGLHVAAEGIILEVLEEGEQEGGKIVVTDLVNRGMPLIRYEIGDRGILMGGSCACGRGLPRLKEVLGRTSDILYAPDGRQISGVSILDTFVIHVSGVQQAQIVQRSLDYVLLRVVRGDGYSPSTRDKLAKTIGQVFGPNMRHDVQWVDRIEPTPRGKYQFSICEIDPALVPGPGSLPSQ